MNNPELTPSTGAFGLVGAPSGITLLDWFAVQERLEDFNGPDVEIPYKVYETLGGSAGGWDEDPLGMAERDARTRARLRYMRAEAMLRARKDWLDDD